MDKQSFYDQLIAEVMSSTQICVALDERLVYLALNEVACSYLKIKQEDLLGKSAIERFPEIIASRNHRNILRALSGVNITGELVESRMGDILKTSYTPKYFDKEIKAVVLEAVIHTVSKNQ